MSLVLIFLNITIGRDHAQNLEEDAIAIVTVHLVVSGIRIETIALVGIRTDERRESAQGQDHVIEREIEELARDLDQEIVVVKELKSSCKKSSPLPLWTTGPSTNN